MREFDELGLIGGNDRGWARGPHPKQQAILDKAEEHVDSVGYRVSLRWVFYRLWQEGMLGGSKAKKGKKAGAYDNLVSLISRAVHSGLWHPALLADESRNSIILDPGGQSFKDWLDDPIYSGVYKTDLSFWATQETFVALAYEANAMTGQFEHYTQGLPIALWPFGGQPSNPYKYSLARFLDEASESYELPIVVLYFGDSDPSGDTIAEVPAGDVSDWYSGSQELTIYRAGLYEDQAREFDVPINPDKPGEYQWEALSDAAAGETITEAIDRYINRDAWKKAREEVKKAYGRALDLAGSQEIEDALSDANKTMKEEFGEE